MLILVAMLALAGPWHQDAVPADSLEQATFGAGCFWCVEAVFERLDGVTDVVAGYAGGTVLNPTGKQVNEGKSGHAEVAQITFDPKKISFDRLLDVFWLAHDPTTADRQGGDVGPQYRSVIFYHNEAQRAAAEESRKKAQAHFNTTIVTAIEPLKAFYKASDYHQDFYNKNPDAPYCKFVISPKLEQLHLKTKGE
jgi:peptide-methionine (S)-S-oxide reductase